VLVTGGGVRLGAQICRAFARAHWDVWCHYQHSMEAAQALCDELCALGVQARTVAADLARAADRQRMMEYIMRTSGPLTCLVNNASTFAPDEAQSLDSASTEHQLAVNLVAPMELSALMARSLPEAEHRGRHSVIHILDQKVLNLNPDYFSYTLSKLALERAVALQAQALANKLRVCGVAPGLMFLSGPQTQENFDIAGRINPMRRPTDPNQVARSCVFLAENDAITGVTLAVDNGQHLIPLPNDVMVVVDHYLQKP
jgi:NAD(P)-dependent dehydrogenase (short-subunit alcohol dehydrogenase family)